MRGQTVGGFWLLYGRCCLEGYGSVCVMALFFLMCSPLAFWSLAVRCNKDRVSNSVGQVTPQKNEYFN